MSDVSSEWTVLLYVGAVDNGQEGVDEAMLATLKDLSANFSPRVHLVYQFATAGHARRGSIVGGSLEETDDLPKIDVATPEPLTEFIDWGTSKFPSRYTALFVKDHGAGFEDPKIANELLSASIPHPRTTYLAMFYNGKTGRSLPTSELATAVARSEIGSVDVYGFDACSMAGMEVSYEVRDVARYVIGSESTESSVGWPYRELLLELSEREGKIPPRELTERLVTLANANDKFSLSVAATTHLKPLAASIDRLARTLYRTWKPEAEKGLAGVQGLGDPDYVDLGALLQGIIGLTQGGATLPAEVGKQATTVLRELREACMASGDSNKPLLSIYYPPTTGSEYLPTYGRVEFGRENAWALFLGVRFYWLLYNQAQA